MDSGLNLKKKTGAFNGVKYCYYVSEGPSRGRSWLLLNHGFGLGARRWNGVAKALLDRGYGVLVCLEAIACKVLC